MIAWVILFFGFLGSFQCQASLQEAEITRKILENNAGAQSVRPVEHYDDILNVTVGVTLVDIVDFDEDDQVVTVKLYLYQEWRSTSTKWSEGGVSDIRLSPNSVWTPDVTFYNGLGSAEPEVRTMLLIKKNGKNIWVPMITNKFRCVLHQESFNCHIKIGSWTYDGFKVSVNPQMDNLNLDFFQPYEWNVISSSAHKHVQYYPCCAEPYEDIVYSFSITKNMGRKK